MLAGSLFGGVFVDRVFVWPGVCLTVVLLAGFWFDVFVVAGRVFV